MPDTQTSYALGDVSVANVPVYTDVTPEIFEREIQSAKSPILMKGLVRDWEICKAASNSPEALGMLLQRHSSQNPVTVNISEPGSGGRYFYRDDLKACNFLRQSATLGAIVGQLLQQLNHLDPLGVYMDATIASDVLPGFSIQHPMPLVPQGTEPRIWLGNSARVAPHFDMSENVACVASGERQFLLFPPEQVANLYAGPLENTPGGAPVSMVDPRHPDLARFPKYPKAMEHAVLAKMETGDALYIPRLWWHYVEASGPLNLLVNYWWDSPNISPLLSLILATRSIRRMPEQDRLALRAFFDHFVFGQDAPAAFDHIPEDVRGVMGVDTPEQDAQLRPLLLKMVADALSD